MYLLDTDMSQCSEDNVQRMLPLVSQERRKQALRHHHTFGRWSTLRTYLMLKELTGEQVDKPWLFNTYGKPYIEGGPEFSISHCKRGLAVATDIHPIGIDIESIRLANESLVRYTMNEEEQQSIFTSADANRTFTTLWTRKEAVLKLLGIGIGDRLKDILSLSAQGIGCAPCHIETIESEEYIVSIAHYY